MKFHRKIHHHLKHVFIPHEHNEYKPHFFREFSVGILFAAGAGLFALSSGSALVVDTTDLGAQVVSNVLIDLTNKDRIENNLPFLAHSILLDKAATLKAENMDTEKYFAHVSPGGVTPWYWFDKAGYTYLYAGENLAINYTRSDEVDNAWMASPLHRANILSDKFREIGISTYSGVYNTAPTVFVVQMFGTPATTQVRSQEVVSAQPSEVTKEKLQEATTETVKKTKTETKKLVEAISLTRAPASTTEQFPEVKGDTVEMKATTAPLFEKDRFAAVKNLQPVEALPLLSMEPVIYSSWYERLLFNGPSYVNIIYQVLFGLVFLALMIMIFVETKVQHTRNIFYGVGVLSMLVVLMITNKQLFVHNIMFLTSLL
jgi:hypothetical protein